MICVLKTTQTKQNNPRSRRWRWNEPKEPKKSEQSFVPDSRQQKVWGKAKTTTTNTLTAKSPEPPTKKKHKTLPKLTKKKSPSLQITENHAPHGVDRSKSLLHAPVLHHVDLWRHPRRCVGLVLVAPRSLVVRRRHWAIRDHPWRSFRRGFLAVEGKVDG